MGNDVEAATLARLRETVQGSNDAYLTELEEFVSVDSGSYDKAGVDAIADRVVSRLSGLGAVIERHGHADLGDTVVGTFEGRADGPTVLLIGHMDTVFEAGTAARHPIRIRDGWAYGPGVGDMKAGLLNGLHAIGALRHQLGEDDGWLPHGRLIFVANPDEEIGSPSSTPLISALARDADVALVLEGARPNGDLVSARKGMMHFEVTIRGRAAHAGVEPEKGRSAVLEAAHKTVALHALHGRWDGVTLNVGSIHGGTRPNIVADEAVITVDMRARDRGSQEEATSAIESIIETTTVPDVVCSSVIGAHHRPMEKTAASEQLIERTRRIASALGFALGDTATGGGSDANTTSALGVPTLDGLGPVAAGAHTIDDRIALDSVVPRTTLLAALLIDVGRGV